MTIADLNALADPRALARRLAERDAELARQDPDLARRRQAIAERELDLDRRRKLTRAWLRAAKRDGLVKVLGGGWWSLPGRRRPLQGLEALRLELERQGLVK